MTVAKVITSPKTNSGEFASPLTTTFYLDDWLVLPELNRLQRRSTHESRSIEPRLMHLLCYLAANELSVIDRDTLVDLLWPNVIVNENSLTRAISELRKQLKDGCERQIIETIPKKGYRLTVSPSIQLVTPASPSQPQTTEERRTLAMTDLLLANTLKLYSAPRAAIVALVLSVSIAIAASFGVPGVQRPANNNFTLVDEILVDEPSYLGGKLALSSANSEQQGEDESTRPIISHDGTNFAYLSHDKDGSTIFIGTLDDMSEPYPLYHDQDKLVNLAWSPVGKSLLFGRQRNLTTAALFSNSRVKPELLVLDITTGKVQRLVEDDLLNRDPGINESSLT